MFRDLLILSDDDTPDEGSLLVLSDGNDYCEEDEDVVYEEPTEDDIVDTLLIIAGADMLDDIYRKGG